MAQCKNTLHLQPGWQSVADKLSESKMAGLFKQSSEVPKMRKNSYLQERSGPILEVGGSY